MHRRRTAPNTKEVGQSACKLWLADQVLLALEYWREYSTMFHLAQRWQLSEASVSRTIEKIENALKNCADLKLPGKKVLRQSDNQIESVVVEATETPIRVVLAERI